MQRISSWIQGTPSNSKTTNGKKNGPHNVSFDAACATRYDCLGTAFLAWNRVHPLGCVVLELPLDQMSQVVFRFMKSRPGRDLHVNEVLRLIDSLGPEPSLSRTEFCAFLVTGNLRTTDNGGPYNISLLTTQANEIRGEFLILWSF